ncbi:MAG TPA: hypothetical protein VHM92_11235 [Allosphingosinicella sp.]|nr:hypothetical protein [Allosphingosinicella sp.]
MRHPVLLSLAALAPAAALAHGVAVSPKPEAVSVTVYRNPDRPPEDALDLGWVGGYALISERRTVSIPAGEAVIRFEGVAGGMLPQSAIVTGLPDGIVEKNRDAWLLSPASLLDASLGKRVHIRRTSRATGAVTETEAAIRSGAEGAVVLETPAGIEALRCTGLPETLVYGEVPEGLSARPTLSVRTRSRQSIRATVTLSYLASGFDWDANYIADLSADGKKIDLFAWLTLANGDETSFVGADAQAVSGKVNREEEDDEIELRREPINLQCWPQGTTTSDLQLINPPPPPPAMAPSEDIMVTGSRMPNLMSTSPLTVLTAEQFELGDLKLYHIPEPVTVAANSQKQIALLRRANVPVRHVYRATFDVMDGFEEEQELPHHFLLATNKAGEGLGLPLPSGGVSLFARAGGRTILLGEGVFPQKAVGEELEIDLGSASMLASRFRFICQAGGRADYELILSNSSPAPVAFEAQLAFNDIKAKARIPDGFMPYWKTSIPANGTRILRFSAAIQEPYSGDERAAAGCSRPKRRK